MSDKLKIGKTYGFTLVELLVALAISSFVLIVLFAIINQVFVRSSGGWEAFKAHTSAQSTTHQMAKELRQVTRVIVAAGQSITFREYVHAEDVAPSEVRFYLEGTRLKRGEIPPTGTGPDYTYDPINETTKILAFNVVNGADRIFSYYDQDGGELTLPINPAELTLVKVSLIFQQLNNTEPFRVETSAQLRFNKTNL